jgi:acyl-CoA thioesterase
LTAASILDKAGALMTDFATLTALRPLTENRFAIDVPDGWQQGRGAFGGFGLACLVRAMETPERNAERPLRTLNAELCGPLLPGPAEIAVEVLRRGAGMTTVTARIVQDGSVVTHASALLGRAREDRSYDGLSAPNLRDSGVLLASQGPWPPFTRFFEYRINGAMPFSGIDVAQVENWVRLRDPGQTFDVAHVTALADATWPALFSIMSDVRPMSTISFTLQLFGPWDGLRTDAPVYHRSRVLWARDGHAAEMRELWTEDGRLLAINHQTFATIR